ncbi:MAG TPA: hypothetical protein VGA49_01210 [Patescibacteria group bacterium]
MIRLKMNNRLPSRSDGTAVIHPAVGGVYYLHAASSPRQAAGYSRADNKNSMINQKGNIYNKLIFVVTTLTFVIALSAIFLF